MKGQQIRSSDENSSTGNRYGSIGGRGNTSKRGSLPKGWQDENSVFGSSKLTPVPFIASSDDKCGIQQVFMS